VITYYSRPVDAGAGRQNVLVKNGVIVKQYLNAREGYYTGAGNPELVGQPESRLRKSGFRHVSGPQVFDRLNNCWISAEVDNDDEETESD
jgi:hypothetical protein